MNLLNLHLSKSALQLCKDLNLNSILEIVRFFPYKYQITKLTNFEELLTAEKITISGSICSKIKFVKYNYKMTKIIFFIKTSTPLNIIKVITYNRLKLAKILPIGTSVTISGKYCSSTRELSLGDLHFGELKLGSCIVEPVYALKKTTKHSKWRAIFDIAFSYMLKNNLLNNIIPDSLHQKYRLVDLKKAIFYAHKPQNEQQLSQAYRYLKYEEFLLFTLKMAELKKQNRKFILENNQKIDISIINQFIASLPFKLNTGQLSVLTTIIDDLNSNQLMYRLLQGDVGSGKTIVSAISLYAIVTSQKQGALLVPTDVLARQHYETFSKLFNNIPCKIALLVGSLSLKEKAHIKDKLQRGEIDIVIGTHSLLQKNVNFKELALVITDEQHRFGVKQRDALVAKGYAVHLLLMSATPIPRTLAMSLYADMDVSILTGYASGQRDIVSTVSSTNTLSDYFNIMNENLMIGRQIYIICPLIENEVTDAKHQLSDVTSVYLLVKNHFQPQFNVALLHGELNNENKTMIMDNFKDGSINILVSTTVVEVGVNVPNANMMFILDSERFGMAALHQLRGRIGRDGSLSYCYLLTALTDENVLARLNFFSKCDDGFKIAEYDFKMRGPGVLTGVKQSGNDQFKVASLQEDKVIFECAKADSLNILKSEDDLENKIILDLIKF